MTYDEVLDYYHNDIKKLADDLDCARQYIYKWQEGEQSKVPNIRQLQLELMTKGRLKADASCFPHGIRP